MMYTDDFQREVLKLLTCNLEFALNYVSFIDHLYFDSREHKIIFRCISSFVYEYEQEVDEKNLKMVADDFMSKQGVDGNDFVSVMNEIAAVYATVIKNEKFIIDELVKFVTTQRLKGAILKSVDILERGSNYEEVLKLVDDALAVGIKIDTGLSFDDFNSLTNNIKTTYDPSRIVRTGFSSYDNAMMGGISSEEVHVIQGKPKDGKSTIACNIGAFAALSGKNVFHISGEIKKLDVMIKYACRLTGMTYAELFKSDIQDYQQKMARFYRISPSLHINSWPEGSSHMLDIRSWISRIRSTKGVSPDLIILDYDDCLTGDTKISLLNGTEVEIKDLVGKDEFWLYSCKEDGEIVPGRGHSARIAKYISTIMEITLDNNEVIKCTPDHKIMIRTGEYKRAKDLVVDDSIMPLYRKEDDCGYEEYLDNKSKVWHKTHSKVAYSCLPNSINTCWERIKSNQLSDKHLVVHHKNFLSGLKNKRNNDPSNLEWLGEHEHWELHSATMKERFESDEEYRNKVLETLSKNRSDKKYIEMMITVRQETMTKQWSDPEFRSMMIETVLESVKRQWDNPEFRDTMLLSVNRQWNDPGFKQKFSDGVKNKWKNEEWAKQRSEEVTKQLLSEVETPRICPKCKTEIISKRGKFANHIRWCKPNNHKVVSIKIINLETSIPVYDITVDKYHNFALSAGVFVHNCFIPSGHYVDGDLYNNSAKVYDDMIGLASYFNCFIKGTNIKTPDGPVEISSIEEGEEIPVYSEKDGKIIEETGYGLGVIDYVNETIELEMDDGSIVECTPDHRFLTKNRGWVEAKDLEESDELY